MLSHHWMLQASLLPFIVRISIISEIFFCRKAMKTILYLDFYLFFFVINSLFIFIYIFNNLESPPHFKGRKQRTLKSSLSYHCKTNKHISHNLNPFSNPFSSYLWCHDPLVFKIIVCEVALAILSRSPGRLTSTILDFIH